MEFLDSLKAQYKNFVMDSSPAKAIEKNVMIVDGGNTSMKFLDPNGNVGIIKTARVKIEKGMEEVITDKEYHVKIEKAVGEKFKDCGTYLFGLAALSDHRYEEIPLGNEKFNDEMLIYQIITIVADKAKRKEPVELRTMLPYTQMGYKETYKKAIMGKYRVTFYNRKNEVVDIEINKISIATEGNRSLKNELEMLFNKKEVNSAGEEYIRKIIAMLDIGGGQVDIPSVIVDKDAHTQKLYEKNLKSFSVNFGMKYIATLLLQTLEAKNISTTADEVIHSIMNYNNKITLPDGKEYDFTEQLYHHSISAFRSILKKYIENLKAQNITNQIGLIYLSGGGSITLVKALMSNSNAKMMQKNKADNIYYEYKDNKIEIRIVGEPIYHNVIGLR